MANSATGKNSDVCRACANVNQRHTQLLLVLGQHGQTGRQRIEHQLINFQAAAAYTLDDVFSSALRPGNDMNLGFQPNTTHADGLAYILPVDDKLLRLNQQQALVGRNVDGLSGFNHAGDVGLRHFLVFDRDHSA